MRKNDEMGLIKIVGVQSVSPKCTAERMDAFSKDNGITVPKNYQALYTIFMSHFNTLIAVIIENIRKLIKFLGYLPV